MANMAHNGVSFAPWPLFAALIAAAGRPVFLRAAANGEIRGTGVAVGYALVKAASGAAL